MVEEKFKVETFKISKGTKTTWREKLPTGEIIEKSYTYPTDCMGISGECSICKCFPCEHTSFVMNDEWQKQQKAKVLDDSS